MKIRKGFVSNSSSSSFILLAKNETETVRDVARIMINRIITDIKYDKWDSKEEKSEWINSRKKWLKKLKTIDKNKPIHFFSINYDTWIIKIADNILISTCNNTIWDLPNITNNISDKTKKELKLKKIDIPLVYDYDFYITDIFDNYYYSLPFGIIGKEISYSIYDETYCKKQTHKYCTGYTQLWETRIGHICPYCDALLFKRKEKLIQLKKINKK